MIFNAIFFDAAVLDIKNFAQTDRMLVFANSTGNNFQTDFFDAFANLFFT
jgi:hypothetical protein